MFRDKPIKAIVLSNEAMLVSLIVDVEMKQEAREDVVF